jgi:hypothetical protein
MPSQCGLAISFLEGICLDITLDAEHLVVAHLHRGRGCSHLRARRSVEEEGKLRDRRAK